MGHCYTPLMIVGEFAVDVGVVIIGGGSTRLIRSKLLDEATQQTLAAS